jgi:predicted dehydrogenase
MTTSINTQRGTSARHRVIIVGTHERGPSWRHALGLLASESAELVAVVNRTVSRAQRFARDHGGACPAYSTLEDAVLHHPDATAVIVCVADAHHAEIAIQALRMKMHVLCEKPPGTSVAEVRAMIDAAEAAGKVLYWGFLFQHMLGKVRHLLNPETLGTVLSGDIGWTRHNGVPGWRSKPTGPFKDLACHLLPLAWAAMGRPELHSISGFAWNQDGTFVDSPRDDTIDSAQATIRFSGPRTVLTVEASQRGLYAAEASLWINLRGTRSGIDVPLPARQVDPSACQPTLHHVVNGVLTHTTKPQPPAFPEAFSGQIKHFFRCIEGKAKPYTSHADAIMVQTVIAGFDASRQRGGDFVSLTD